MNFEARVEVLFQMQRMIIAQQRECMLTALQMAFLIPRLLTKLTLSSI